MALSDPPEVPVAEVEEITMLPPPALIVALFPFEPEMLIG